MGRALRFLQAASALLMIVTVLMGYATARGLLGVERHIPFGFLFALVIAFAHAMTIFYFAGLGVSMRQAVGSRGDLGSRLQEASRIRRSLALPLGLAVVTLMATVILGGGSHTRTLPGWVHHLSALAALGFTLFAALRSVRGIEAYELLADRLREDLEGPPGQVDRPAPNR